MAKAQKARAAVPVSLRSTGCYHASVSSGPCGLYRVASSVNGDAIAEFRLEAGYAHGRHTHSHQGLALGLGGTYVARVGRREHALSAGDVLVFPDAAAHSELAGSRGSHCLLLQLAGPFEDRRLRSVFERDRVIASPVVGGLAKLIASELAADDGARGIALEGLFDDFTIQMQFALPMIPVGMAVYYLAWKHLVSRLNAELGIADA